jgi:hypothetical protein
MGQAPHNLLDWLDRICVANDIGGSDVGKIYKGCWEDIIGFDLHIVELQKFKESVSTATTMHWDDDDELYVPGERFGGRNPATMSFKGFGVVAWLPWRPKVLPATKESHIGLREIVHGSEISSVFVGMMVECG